MEMKNVKQNLLIAFLTAKGTEFETPLEEIEDFIVNDDSGFCDTNFFSVEDLDQWLHSWENFTVFKEEETEDGYSYRIANFAGTIEFITNKSIDEYKEEMGY